jgi:hypothetical protein
MTVQNINIGNQVNDGLGDDLRTAFEKVNANFISLGAELTVTASNAGLTGVRVFRQKTGSDLEFRRLRAGNKIVLEETDTNILITSNQADAFTSITTDTGVVVASSLANTVGITLQGSKNINVTSAPLSGTITVDTDLDLNQILLNMDFGPITSAFVNPTQFALQASNIDFGTIEIPGALSLDLGAP